MFGEGPLLLLAGPGSGKTFTITKRILWLIHEKKVAPEQILVITFTRESALSMKQRFTQISPQTNPVNFGTFHSVFYQILLQSGRVQLGNILTERQKLNLIFPLLKKKKDCNSDTAKNFLAAISYYKNTGEDKYVEKLPQEWRELFPQVYREYEAVRRKVGGLDFDDMLKECEELLQKDITQREHWQKRFAHILIDEFQDINYRQYEIIRLLAEKHRNVFAVGDDDQAIYGFRGSRPACMKLFEQEFGADRILLGINYRSHQDIVDASLKVISENRDRFPKKLCACEANQRKKSAENTRSESGVKVKQFREASEQTQYLVERLKKREEEETYALLFRTNLSMQSMAVKFVREGIPFSMKEKSRNIYEHFIVQDIMAFLRIAMGTAERSDYLRVINKPFRNVSREAFENGNSLQALEDYYSESFRMIPDAYRQKAKDAVKLLIRQMEFVQKSELKLGVMFLRKACGYERYLRQRATQEQRTEITEWMDILEWITEDAGNYKNPEEWQEAQDAYGEKMHMENQPLSTDEKIRLLTVHASKGLEFDHVWIPDCNEKSFPHGNTQDPEHLEEERRIFYVAMTRAKKDLELLCLTGTGERPRFPSRFLIPLNRYRQ